MIRDILKFQQVFVDGRGYAGVASAIEVPKVEQVMRDYSAGGMGGNIEVPMGRLEKLTATVTFQGFAPELYTHFGIVEGALVPFTVRGSAEDGNGTTHSHVVKMRGLIKKIDESEWKDGEEVPLKLDLSLRYYKRQRDGVDLIEADPVNMIFRVAGVDQLAAHRANIGL